MTALVIMIPLDLNVRSRSHPLTNALKLPFLNSIYVPFCAEIGKREMVYGRKFLVNKFKQTQKRKQLFRHTQGFFNLQIKLKLI